MSELYTRFMEWVMPFLQANWQFFFIVTGALFLLGAIFRWKWVCDPQCWDFGPLFFATLEKKGIALFKGSAEPSLSYAA